MVKAILAASVILTTAWAMLLAWLIVSGVSAVLGSESKPQPNQSVDKASPHEHADFDRKYQ